MSELPVFGAGVWHVATYEDRYASDGYGRDVGLLEKATRHLVTSTRVETASP